MRIRVFRPAMKSAIAVVAVVAAAATLSGCSTFGMGADPTTTGSINSAGASNLNQPMPPSLGGASQRVAEGPYTPPEDVGDGAPVSVRDYASVPSGNSSSSVSSNDLPVIGSTASNGGSAMPASNLATISAAPKPLLATTPAPNFQLLQGSAPAGVYYHVIKSGESLYTIAKHYNVTAQAIMQASGISAPDKIFVGQRIVIPGRPDLLAALDNVKPGAAAGEEKLPVDSNKPLAQIDSAVAALHAGAGETHVASLGDQPTTSAMPLAGRVALDKAPSSAVVVPLTPPPTAHTTTAKAAPALTPTASLAPSAAPATQQASIAPSAAQAPLKTPLTDPATSGADKFRWPVTGKVVMDFAATKGTGINIAAPEGTPVRAAENGTVIYVGSGVEGYGNLVLIRHANGYVTAYANLKDMSVVKNAQVSRGDIIGTTGTTGAVASPQLHFELRKGATPVDPVPLLG